MLHAEHDKYHNLTTESVNMTSISNREKTRHNNGKYKRQYDKHNDKDVECFLIKYVLELGYPARHVLHKFMFGAAF